MDDDKAASSGPWHHEMKKHMKGRVSEFVAGRTGPSLEQKLQVEKDKKIQAMKLIEKEQREAIKAATERGLKKQQLVSPLQALKVAPHFAQHVQEKNAQREEERKQEMAEKEKAWQIQREAMLEKMRTREPLFRPGDEAEAKRQLAEAQRKRQAELAAEEKKRWQELEEAAARGCHKRQTLFTIHKSESFDSRMEKRVKQKTEEMKELDREQKDRIKDLIASGQARSQSMSPLAAALRANKPTAHEAQMKILQERTRAMTAQMKDYFQKRDEMLHRQKTREPLFSNAAVETAAQEAALKAKKVKQEMMAEHQKQKQHIGDLQNRALSTPLLMERNRPGA
eukprot:gb/GFBE01012939.1/.p1 GENE.gb/GFBE01012939.1/~~gb/GFBE01012939.1/.p1  ORF type:complete len:339 (+),score=103.19 gb/GFBE01012939.1/:1-1017(+)